MRHFHVPTVVVELPAGKVAVEAANLRQFVDAAARGVADPFGFEPPTGEPDYALQWLARFARSCGPDAQPVEVYTVLPKVQE